MLNQVAGAEPGVPMKFNACNQLRASRKSQLPPPNVTPKLRELCNYNLNSSCKKEKKPTSDEHFFLRGAITGDLNQMEKIVKKGFKDLSVLIKNLANKSGLQ